MGREKARIPGSRLLLVAGLILGWLVGPAPAAESATAPAVGAAGAVEQPPPAVGGGPAKSTLGPTGATNGHNGKNGKNGTIELHIKDDQLANVLELLSQQYRLNIVASKSATGRVTADLYDVTIEEALDAICRGAGLGWKREGKVIYIYSQDELKSMASDESRLETEVFQLNYLSAKEAVALLASATSEKGTVTASSEPEEGIPSGSGGGTGGNTFCLPDTVVVRDFPENIEQMRDVLSHMDRRPRQVLIEATILQVSLDDNTSLGVDFNVLAGVDFRDLSNVATPVTDPTALANDATVTLPADQAPYGTVGQNGFATPGNGLNIGVMTNNVSVFINALETVTDTTILSNPKVLALNKQRAEVMVGERLGYRTTTVTETSAVEAVEFLDTGTQLIFRPFISDDGYVRMEIHPEVSTGVVVAGLPQETTTEITCNVMVKDGHTILIGGLFDEDASIGRSQVPGLGNIPGLGWLFRSKEDSTTRNEYVILLTPHIIDEPDAAAALGESLLFDAKRRVLGMREGFSFFTRERITVGYVQTAQQAWTRYQETSNPKDLDEAWWNVQLANDVAPNNLRTLRLKDKVLTARNGEPYTPPHVTIWDSIRERLRAIDEARGVTPPWGPEFQVPESVRTGARTVQPVPVTNPTASSGPADEAKPKEPDHAN